ncbi:hypothetical protein [Komagataeibacter phage phiKX1]|nr:hypothetical protein [Komagataeibacter phage phiKX1]BCZ76115.1 hypothetical protein [Komagataeibacter phage phiKX2]
MTYRAQRPHDCEGHAPFARRSVAVRQARKMRAQDIRVDVFGCSFCGHWHVGGVAFGKKGGRPEPRAVQIGFGGLG